MTDGARVWKVVPLARGACDNCHARFETGAHITIRELEAILCDDCCSMLAAMMRRIR